MTDKAQLTRHITASITYELECVFCTETIDDEDNDTEGAQIQTAKGELADTALLQGWDIVNSEKYGLIGVGCPDCVAKPDHLR